MICVSTLDILEGAEDALVEKLFDVFDEETLRYEVDVVSQQLVRLYTELPEPIFEALLPPYTSVAIIEPGDWDKESAYVCPWPLASWP